MLKIVQIPDKGRGIITTKAVAARDFLEQSPVCVLSAGQRELIGKTALFDYCFVQPSEYAERKEAACGYIVFGLTSFCNHSDKPNAEVKWITTEIGVWAQLIAIQDIHPNEEVTMFYANLDEYPLAAQFISS